MRRMWMVLILGLVLVARAAEEARTVVLPAETSFLLASGTTTLPLAPHDFAYLPDEDGDVLQLDRAAAQPPAVRFDLVTRAPGEGYTFVAPQQPEIPVREGTTLIVRAMNGVDYYKLEVTACTPTAVSLSYRRLQPPAAAGPVRVTVLPALAFTFPGRTVRYRTLVTGTPQQEVTWTRDPAAPGGTIDPTGAYLAPAEPGTYLLRATSVADPAQSAVAGVNVYRDPRWLIGTWAGSLPDNAPTPGAAITLTITEVSQPDDARPIVACAGTLRWKDETLPVTLPYTGSTAHPAGILWTFHNRTAADGHAAPAGENDWEELRAFAARDPQHALALHWEHNVGAAPAPAALACTWTLRWGALDTQGEITLTKRPE